MSLCKIMFLQHYAMLTWYMLSLSIDGATTHVGTDTWTAK